MKSLWRQANDISIVDYLSNLGHNPKKAYGARLDYFSPIQEEKNRSFCVYVSTNSWYDWGRGMGGGIINLVEVLENCSRGDAINKLLGGNFAYKAPEKSNKVTKKSIEVLKEGRIEDIDLINYLWKRNINPRLAGLYCKEVAYFFPLGKYPDRVYTGIGFQNKKGGWEIRSAKARWFINMLSFLHYYGYTKIKATIIVLNGWTMVKYLDFKRFRKVYSFLDNFEKKKLNGLTATEEIIKCIKDSGVYHIDRSNVYKDYKDFNSLITNGEY